ncbi:MAG: hypothetical protein ACKO6F_06600 [Cyanobium sp.]
MVSAPPSPDPEARPGPRLQRMFRRRSRWDWPMWLFVGACFGLGYGFTQRLMRINVSEAWKGEQLFGVKPFPGTSLPVLRQRAGGGEQPLRADLDLLEQEGRKAEQARELERREADMTRREEEDKERLQREAERARLEALERQAAPPPPAQEDPEPLPPGDSPLLSPPEPSPEPSPEPPPFQGQPSQGTQP